MALTNRDLLPTELKRKVVESLLYAKGTSDDELYALEVDPTTGGLPVVQAPLSGKVVDTVAQDISGITTAAYTEIVASTSDDIFTLDISETGGQVYELATGAAASETPLCHIPPGGFAAPLTIFIASGTRLSIKPVDGNVTSGYFVANFLGIV